MQNKEEKKIKLENKLNIIGIKSTDEQIENLIKYYEMLVEKNKVMNLTSITEFDEVVDKHFIDSLMICNFVEINNQTIIDIGTGAGFPGIPLKIMFPDISITLIDSLNKRINWLREVCDELKLDKIKLVHGRAEDIAKNEEYREKYDLCVSRAVANLSTLAEYCTPFVKVSGLFIPYKSGEIEEELNISKIALKILNCKIKEVKQYNLPDTNISRSFVKIVKFDNTPAKYPRKAGMPSKQPLGG